MTPYARMLLHFAHSLAGRLARVEAFVFATRLTRITRELRRPAASDAVPRVPRLVGDWSGGTRIGDALRTFNVAWARRVMGHGPVVLRWEELVWSRTLLTMRRSMASREGLESSTWQSGEPARDAW